MTARILDGKAIAAQIRSEVAERVRGLAETGITPAWPPSSWATTRPHASTSAQKHKACADVGIRSEQVDLPSYVTEHELLATIRRLNRDPEIHGIIVQLPLPSHLHELEIQRAVAPEKDVDGLHPWNIGMMLRQGPVLPPGHALRHRRAAAPCRGPDRGRRGHDRRASASWSARPCR